MATNQHGRIEVRELEHEMRTSYLEYAMSVIVGRALPDVRDGLKPVHRRVLYAMHDMGLQPDRPYTKCAKVVGEVMGNFHPHGDSAIYDALVRLAQDFASRYPLIDGQGNFGSAEFPAAAMRYTEARLAKLATEILRDIDEDTVDFGPNYDDKRTEPLVLPARVPNLLINGSTGIAVGMATNIPPHNAGEIIDATIAMIDDPSVTTDELRTHVQGPDFPTGGVIVGKSGIADAYRTGRGRVVVRGRSQVEELRNGRTAIVFSELPYQVNKSELAIRIAQLAKDGVIPEISDVNDESGRDGLRFVVQLKRDAIPKVVLNKLYKHTPCQSTFGVNAIALVDGVPRTLGLRDILFHYLEHQREVITRRSRHRLARAEESAHILEGLLIALADLDAVIELIRRSSDPADARQGLVATFSLSEVQAQAILDLRLQRLTQLEGDKIRADHARLRTEIEALRHILSDEAQVDSVIRQELLEVRDRYADERRTEIEWGEGEIDMEDLIAEEEMIVSITRGGYVKRLTVDTYRSQHRGGKGLRGTKLKEEDVVDQLFVASTHDYLLFFTNQGRVYRQKVYELPQASRDAQGRHIANVLALLPDEDVRVVVATRDYSEGEFLVLATRDGYVKKTAFKAYDTVLKERGLTAIHLEDGDEVVAAQLTSGTDDLLVVSARGQAARFDEDQCRPMGRDTRGVLAMRLAPEDQVLTACVATDDDLLVVTGNGYGKRTPMADYPRKGRPTKGVRTIQVTSKKGELVTAQSIRDDQEILLVSEQGQVIRILASTVRQSGRISQGVRLMDVGDDDRVVRVAPVDESDAALPVGDELFEDGADTSTVTASDGAELRVDDGDPPSPEGDSPDH